MTERERLVEVWSYENDAGNREHVAVLGVPPVTSAQDAVRATIAAEAKPQ